MHIGYVLKKYPRISETFILNEMLELERQGVELTVFSLYKHDEGLFHPGVCELRAPVVYLADVKGPGLQEALRDHGPLLLERAEALHGALSTLVDSGAVDVWRQLAWGLQLALEVRARGIERLHAHFATSAAQAAATAHTLTGVPYSFTCHAKDIYRETVDPSRFQRLAGAAAAVVTVCDANRRHIDERLLDGSPAAVHRVYNGIDLELFSPRPGAPDPSALILAVGRLVPKKGFPTLLEAAALLRDRGVPFRCAIVGDGEQRAEIERRRRQLRLDHCELLGSLPQPQVKRLMQDATAVALPCTVDPDGNQDALPTVLLEALASGVPTISTPVAGVPEILDDGSAGLLVPVDDPTALADALQRLLTEPTTRAELARRGRRRAEELFDLTHNVRQLRAILREATPRESAA